MERVKVFMKVDRMYAWKGGKSVEVAILSVISVNNDATIVCAFATPLSVSWPLPDHCKAPLSPTRQTTHTTGHKESECLSLLIHSEGPPCSSNIVFPSFQVSLRSTSQRLSS